MIATPAELRFHWYRLGNREGLKKLFKVGTATLAKLMPEDHTDRYMRGQMVNISGILAKKCVSCGTAREAEQFYIDNARASGCRATCQKCREAI